MQEFMLLKYAAYLVASMMNSISITYLWTKIFKKQNWYKQGKYYFTFLSLLIFSIINNEFISQGFKIFFYSIFCFTIIILVFTKNVEKAVNATITTHMISMLAELIVVFIFSAIYDDNDLVIFLQTTKGFVSINFGVSIFISLSAKIGIPTKIYNLLCKITNTIKKKRLIAYTIIIIATANFLTFISYYHLHISLILIINTCLIGIYSVIIFNTVKTNNNMQKITNKYNLSLNTLRESEKLLDDYKMYSHENKNTLRTIERMIETDDKELLNYVKTAINDKEQYGEEIIDETSTIPLSGLRAIIYSKMKEMKHYCINSELYIDKNIKSADLININDNTLLDICKIVGVFLDNAIEATKDLNDKHINISIYNDENKIVIKISNNFTQIINFKNINKKGYSTKGEKHGYGLPLVETILENNKKLENYMEINNNIFSQIIKIKI